MNYFTSFIQELYYQFYLFWSSPDYSVRRVYLYYQADSVLDGDTDLKGNWVDEARYWLTNGESGGYYRDITQEFRCRGEGAINHYFDTQPSNVSHILVNVKYTFSNKSYNYVAQEGSDFRWPPPASEEMKFHLPITGTWASRDGEDKTMDISGRLRRVAGPRGDFHGQDVKFSDVMKYDHPKVIVETMISTRICDAKDSVLSLI
jgi:hypothetical protein